jgi:hypothetical protein
MWSVLLLTLPTQPNAVRLRVWRALKTLGCGSMRDGVYVLPESRKALFDPLVSEVRAHGGQASVLELSASDEAQRAEILALFDRTAAYGQWRLEARTLAAALPELTETEARRRWRAVSEALQAIVRIDYYPGAAAEQAQAELDVLREALDARFSRGEPLPQAPHGIPRLDLRKFQGKRWATRARPWVDRLACAWLIRRFIDTRRASSGWPTPPDPRQRLAAHWVSTTTARASRMSAHASASRCWPRALAWTRTHGCSASRRRCTSWTSAASRCPRRPAWRRCSPACARFMPTTIN